LHYCEAKFTYILVPLIPYGIEVVSFIFDYFTEGVAIWTSDQLASRPLPKHGTTYTQNKNIRIPNIHALNAIRTHDPGFTAREKSTCLRRLSYRDRL
jgi:hypothetical protein